jgi:hypothetical protein
MFEKLGKLIEQLQDQEFEVVRSRGSLALQQTQRNQMKEQLMQAMHEGFQELGDEYGFDVYFTAEGIIFEVKNMNVIKRVNRMRDIEHEKDIKGYISLEHNIKIKNLDYDAEVEEESYLSELAEEEQQAKIKEAQKRDKIKRDAELRAGKARMREQKIAALMKEEAGD